MVIAVDFDGILCEVAYPEIGTPIILNINLIKDARLSGHKIILWTCRSGKKLQEALIWCRHHNLIFDAVNKNLPERIKEFKGDTRKISADIYLDDKNCSIKELWENIYG